MEYSCNHCAAPIDSQGHLEDYGPTIVWCKKCCTDYAALLSSKVNIDGQDRGLLEKYGYTHWPLERWVVFAEQAAKVAAIMPVEGVCPQCRKKH
jgi:hypothetical protein